MGRLKAFDGLRAIAVLAVLASHTLPRAHGGFLGVDVFFVLSGYLITSLMIKEFVTTGRLDFVAFYRRRAARLFPAYLAMLALTVPLMIGPLHDVGDWPWPLVVAVSAVYGANWAQAGAVEHMGPLLHTWSLSVEEQFYLVWPIAFIVMIRARRSPIGWISAAALVTVGLRTGGWLLHPGLWPYFATVTHADGLLLGALIGVLMAPRAGARKPAAPGTAPAAGAATSRRAQRERQLAGSSGVRWWSGPAAWLGAGVLGAEMLVLDLDQAATYLAGLTVSALATGLMVRHLVVADRGVMVRLLSLRPLVWIGRLSYGLYLYHMPIFILAQRSNLGFVKVLTLESAGTAVVTLASWFLLERPVQRWVAKRWPRGVASPKPSTKVVAEQPAGLVGAGVSRVPAQATGPSSPWPAASPAPPTAPVPLIASWDPAGWGSTPDPGPAGPGPGWDPGWDPTPRQPVPVGAMAPAGWPSPGGNAAAAAAAPAGRGPRPAGDVGRLPAVQALPPFRPDLVPIGPAWDFIAIHPVSFSQRPAPVFAVPAWDISYAAPAPRRRRPQPSPIG